MSSFEKRLKKFMKRPAPSDITLEEVAYLARGLGFEIETGSKHPLRIVDPETHEIYTVPERNGLVRKFYVSTLQVWFRERQARENI